MGWFRETFANTAPATTADADDVLVRSFVRDSNAVALSTLVERHLPMVFRVCRSILGQDHDAEDATQATFLVLTQRAGTIRNQNSLASWLHGVALQSARAVRRRQQRERQRIEKAGKPEATGDALDDLTLREAREILHAELDKLPDRDKVPILLVHFEDRSHEEAARVLGLSLSAFRGRLERARQRLGERLARHRLSLTATLSLVLLTVNVPSALATTVTASLVANSHPASATAAAAMVPGTNTGSSTVGVGAIVAGTFALFVALPMMWPTPNGTKPVTSYPRGHILIAVGDHVAVLNPDDGRATPVSPKLASGRFQSIRVRPDGGALAYERDDGTLHYWRFDEPFPGIQAAKTADAYAWLHDGRLSVATTAQIDVINVSNGERETIPVPGEYRILDVHPDGETAFVVSNVNDIVSPAILKLKTQEVQRIDCSGTLADFMTWRFSPTGAFLAGILADESALTIVDSATRAKRTVPCPDAGRFFAWSPHGELALVGRKSMPASLLLVPLETSDSPRVLTLAPQYRQGAAILQSGGADWCW